MPKYCTLKIDILDSVLSVQH